MATEQGYRTLFQTYIVAGAAASLARVRQAEAGLAETDRGQAWQTLSYALALEEAWPVAAELLLALAPLMARAGFWSEWLPYLEQGLVQSKAMQDPDVEAELALHLAYLYQRLGYLEKARRCASDAVDLFAHQNNHRRQCAALNRLAGIARTRRDFAAVERLTDAALDLLSSEVDPDIEELGHAFLIKGRSAYEQRLWSLAGGHFERALGFYERAGNQGRIAVCIQNLGRVCYQEKDYDGAIAYAQRAIKLLEAANDVFELAAVQMNLGIVYSLCGRPQAALAEYTKAEVVFRRLQDRAHLARLFNNQGIEMNNLERWADAKQLLQTSGELWLELDNLQGYLDVQDSLGLSYMGSEEFDQVIRIYEEALALSEKQTERGIAERTLASLIEHLSEAQKAREMHPLHS